MDREALITEAADIRARYKEATSDAVRESLSKRYEEIEALLGKRDSLPHLSEEPINYTLDSVLQDEITYRTDFESFVSGALKVLFALSVFASVVCFFMAFTESHSGAGVSAFLIGFLSLISSVSFYAVASVTEMRGTMRVIINELKKRND